MILHMEENTILIYILNGQAEWKALLLTETSRWLMLMMVEYSSIMVKRDSDVLRSLWLFEGISIVNSMPKPHLWMNRIDVTLAY